MVELTLRGVNFHFAPQGKKGNPWKNMKERKKSKKKVTNTQEKLANLYLLSVEIHNRQIFVNLR